MSKKLGLILTYVGAYAILLGGLFFVMHFDGKEIQPQNHDWVWGLLTAIVVVCGAVLAGKKKLLCFLGWLIALAGAVATVFVIRYGIESFNYYPPFLIGGDVCVFAGIVIGFIYSIRDTIREAKYGVSLL